MIENSSQNMTACLRTFRPSTDPIEVIISTKSDRGSKEEGLRLVVSMLVFLNRFERNRAGAMFCVALFCRWFFFCSIPFSPKQMLRSIDAFFIVVNFTSRSLGFLFYSCSFIPIVGSFFHSVFACRTRSVLPKRKRYVCALSIQIDRTTGHYSK